MKRHFHPHTGWRRVMLLLARWSLESYGRLRSAFLAFFLFLCLSAASADIFEWAYVDPMNPALGKFETSTPVPDGVGVNAVPSANLSLRDLTKAYLIGRDLTGANLLSANLTIADLTGASLWVANLTNTVFTGATITGVDLRAATSNGFTEAQLAATASYLSSNLAGVGFRDNDLTNWNLSGQNLTGAVFRSATLSGTNLAGATVAGADFTGTTALGLTEGQFALTASFIGGNLTGIRMGNNTLNGWNFSSKTLASASFLSANLTSANFSGANLNSANLTTANLNSANLTSASITGANLRGATANGLSKAQFESTASFSGGTLGALNLRDNNLAGWNFSNQSLAGADFRGSIIGAVDFSNANLTSTQLSGLASGTGLIGASFNSANLTGSNIASSNLSTATFVSANLTFASFNSANLTHANLSNARLHGANFESARLTSATLTGALILNTNFSFAAGFTEAQLISTASYQSGQLPGIGLAFLDVSGWDLSNQNLTGAIFSGAIVAGTDFAGATVQGGAFDSTGLTKAQLESTASFLGGNLTNMALGGGNDLSGWNFNNKNLTGSSLGGSSLAGATFVGATIRGIDLDGVTGLQEVQIAATQSFVTGDLQDIIWNGNNLSGWDFSGMDLSGGAFLSANLTGTDLSFADARGATNMVTAGAGSLANFIQPNGIVSGGLQLGPGQILQIRDSNSGLLVQLAQDSMVDVLADLALLIEDSSWGSTIELTGGSILTLAGDLVMELAPGRTPADLGGYGAVFQFFDWSGGSRVGTFASITLVGDWQGYSWDDSQLYIDGTMTLVPEPRTMGLLLAFGLFLLVGVGLRRPKATARPVVSPYR